MKIRKLNILMRYPVNWTEYTVMNNYVQNFYDSVGPEEFANRFNMSYSEDTLVMAADTEFSMDWLLYMGASTKRNTEKYFAGRFGEGFKVASLVAYRDLKLGVTMESKDWKITVTEAEQVVNGIKETALAYKISKRPFSETTRLILTGVSEAIYKVALYEVDNFFYEGNPKFGDLITKGKKIAIYRSVRKDDKFLKGGVFINMQQRLRMRIPLYFCNHDFYIGKDDRDRGELSEREWMDAICGIIKQIDAKSAVEVLETFKSLWFDYRERSTIHRDWTSVIKELITVITKDKNVCKSFCKKYEDKIVSETVSDLLPNHKKTLAYHWFKTSKYKERKRVGTLFTELGIKDIYTLCEENGGLDLITEPNDFERKRIKILEDLSEKYFSELLCYKELPKCKVIANKNCPNAGEALSFKAVEKVKNTKGISVRLIITEIRIEKKVIDDESLLCALPIYMHELLHQFGGDTSLNFHNMLLEMNRVFLLHRGEIKSYEKRWDALCGYTA